MTIEVKAHPMGGEAMIITLNKHAIRAVKDGKTVSLELVTGDRKVKFSFMRDTALVEENRKKQKKEKSG